MNHQSTFENKTVIITEGSSGIGRADTVQFAEQGAGVAVTASRRIRALAYIVNGFNFIMISGQISSIDGGFGIF